MAKKIKINGKKVTAIVFKDGGTIPVNELPENVVIELKGFGKGTETISTTSVIQGKNLVSGSSIISHGDFRLGDG